MRLPEEEKEITNFKRQIISTILHEFRNPLSVILSSVQIIDNLYDSLDDMKKKNIFNRIYDSIDFINSVLNNIKIINIEDKNQILLKSTSINIEQFCNDIADELKCLYPEKNIKTQFNFCKEDYYIDKNLIRQVLTNLLRNSIKYSPSIGSDISFCGKSTDDNHLEFIIKDNGIGIREEDMEYIFEPFYRASNITGIKGMGLGLAIVKKCVEVLNGDIQIESKFEIGTTIRVNIPENIA
ncbi:MAG: HAMP domain-containing sensor histidine kinase [Bacteroidota bacterium]|nr:HAMP domain-containing sensor histidine kinase [Bacteroidota bacterium]